MLILPFHHGLNHPSPRPQILSSIASVLRVSVPHAIEPRATVCSPLDMLSDHVKAGTAGTKLLISNPKVTKENHLLVLSTYIMYHL